MDEDIGPIGLVFVAAAILLFAVLPWGLRRIFRHFGSRRIRRVRVTEAANGQPCRLAGTARRHPDHPPLTTRFSEKEVLWCRARLLAFVQHDPNRESDDNPFDEVAQELNAVDAFWLEDDSGRALVRLFHTGTERELVLPCRSYKKLPTEKVEAMLEAKGRSLGAVREHHDIYPEDLHVEEELLREGDRVVVVGTCRHEAAAGGQGGGAYREAPLQRVVQGERTLPLRIYAREEDVARLSR